MLCASIIDNGGKLAADKTIKYVPEKTVLKIEIGGEIKLSEKDFAALSSSFLEDIEKKYS